MEKQKIATKTPLADAVKAGELSFKFVNGTTLSIKRDQVPADLVDTLIFHGLSQKIGDSYAGAKGDVDEAIESAGTVIERIIAGDWAAEREAAGPRPSLVADAVIAAKDAAGLFTGTDEAIVAAKEAVRAKYVGKDSADTRKKALDNPSVRAHFDRIKAEAAAKRAAESLAKATGATASVDSL